MFPKPNVLEEQDVRLRFVNFVVLPTQTLREGGEKGELAISCTLSASPLFRVAGAF